MSTIVQSAGPSSAAAPAGSSEAVQEAPVLFVINGEHYSGAERVQDLLALRLPEFGYRVSFACLKPGQFPRLRAARESPLFELPMRGRFDLGTGWQLARLVRQEGFRLIHAHTPRSALVARLASFLTGVPLVYHVHSPAARDSTRRWRNVAVAWTESIALAGAARVICVSRSLAEHMRGTGFSPQRIAVAANGVPCLERMPDRQPPSSASGWTLGCVALFRPRKGLEVLLEALALLRAEECAGADVRLLAVGAFETADYQREILARAGRLGLLDAIEWTGFASDVRCKLARMDLLVLPSLFGEGLPMVVLEAMAAGVPVVATRVEGVPEAIRDARDGLLAAPGDPNDLAQCIRRLVRGEVAWLELRASAAQRQAACFSDRGMAAAVAAVYGQVLAGDSSGRKSGI